MTISDDLFVLINTLKQTEKRYFKIFASIHVKGEKNNYVRLFDVIEQQNEYDEPAILKHFEGLTFIKQFAVTKNYLYNFILRSLRSYYSGNTAESRIIEDLESIRILFGKGMYKRCIKLINRTKKICWNYDKYEQLLTLIKWENEVNTRHLKGSALDEYRESSAAEYGAVLNVLQEKHTLKLLEQKAFGLYRRFTIARSDDDLTAYKEILQHPALSSDNAPTSFIARLILYNIKGVYATIAEQHDEAISYDRKRLKLFEENPQFIKENLIQYIKVQNNMLHNYLELEQIEDFKKTLKEMRSVGEKFASSITNSERAILFETTYSLELSYYYRNIQFEEALKIIPEVNRILGLYDNLLVIEFRTEILFIIAKIYYYSGCLDEASDWVNRIVFDEKPNGADDLLCFARVLNLMIHYDLGNDELLKYEIKSTQRFLTKKKRLFKVEALTLNTMGRLVQQNDHKSRIKMFEKFREELQKIMSQPYEVHALAYLNMLSWIESKISNRPLAQIMQAADSSLPD